LCGRRVRQCAHNSPAACRQKAPACRLIEFALLFAIKDHAALAESIGSCFLLHMTLALDMLPLAMSDIFMLMMHL